MNILLTWRSEPRYQESLGFVQDRLLESDEFKETLSDPEVQEALSHFLRLEVRNTLGFEASQPHFQRAQDMAEAIPILEIRYSAFDFIISKAARTDLTYASRALRQIPREALHFVTKLTLEEHTTEEQRASFPVLENLFSPDNQQDPSPNLNEMGSVEPITVPSVPSFVPASLGFIVFGRRDIGYYVMGLEMAVMAAALFLGDVTWAQRAALAIFLLHPMTAFFSPHVQFHWLGSLLYPLVVFGVYHEIFPLAENQIWFLLIPIATQILLDVFVLERVHQWEKRNKSIEAQEVVPTVLVPLLVLYLLKTSVSFKIATNVGLFLYFLVVAAIVYFIVAKLLTFTLSDLLILIVAAGAIIYGLPLQGGSVLLFFGGGIVAGVFFSVVLRLDRHIREDSYLSVILLILSLFLFGLVSVQSNRINLEIDRILANRSTEYDSLGAARTLTNNILNYSDWEKAHDRIRQAQMEDLIETIVSEGSDPELGYIIALGHIQSWPIKEDRGDFFDFVIGYAEEKGQLDHLARAIGSLSLEFINELENDRPESWVKVKDRMIKDEVEFHIEITGLMSDRDFHKALLLLDKIHDTVLRNEVLRTVFMKVISDRPGAPSVNPQDIDDILSEPAREVREAIFLVKRQKTKEARVDFVRFFIRHYDEMGLLDQFVSSFESLIQPAYIKELLDEIPVEMEKIHDRRTGVYVQKYFGSSDRPFVLMLSIFKEALNRIARVKDLNLKSDLLKTVIGRGLWKADSLSFPERQEFHEIITPILEREEFSESDLTPELVDALDHYRLERLDMVNRMQSLEFGGPKYNHVSFYDELIKSADLIQNLELRYQAYNMIVRRAIWGRDIPGQGYILKSFPHAKELLDQMPTNAIEDSTWDTIEEYLTEDQKNQIRSSDYLPQPVNFALFAMEGDFNVPSWVVIGMLILGFLYWMRSQNQRTQESENGLAAGINEIIGTPTGALGQMDGSLVGYQAPNSQGVSDESVQSVLEYLKRTGFGEEGLERMKKRISTYGIIRRRILQKA